jgi:cephalosporin hydroxylase
MDLNHDEPVEDVRWSMLRAPYTHLPSILNELLFGEYISDWIMQHEERSALISLLSAIRPECAIEIGTANGGSLSAIAKFSRLVYSLDIDPACPERLAGMFPNVVFITGPSQETLPPLLQRLRENDVNVEFILINGDHSWRGVKRDIENLLRVRPTRPLYMILHDSFMPKCRRGMVEADWGASPYVHFVELDFIPGRFEPNRQMTCGFALAILLPVKRSGELVIHKERESIYQAVLRHSVHRTKYSSTVVAKLGRKLGSYLKH